MAVRATLVEAVPEAPHGQLFRADGKVEPVPIHAFQDDLQRKVSLRKMMVPDDKKKGQGEPGGFVVQAEAIGLDDDDDEGLEELGAPGSGMGGADTEQGRPGSTTLPGGDEEAEGMFDDECPDQYKDEDGNCPGDDGFDPDTMGQYDSGDLWGSWDSEKEVAPPGYEDMVLKLKQDKSVSNPFAVAWAAYNKAQGGKKATESVRGVLLEPHHMSPQLFDEYARFYAK